MLRVIDLSFILLNTSREVLSIRKEFKYTTVLLSISNETPMYSFTFLPSRFMKKCPSFILGKLLPEKALLNLI